MKKCAIFVFSFLLVAWVSPSISNAEITATTTPPADGPGETISVRRELIRGWQQQSNELKQKIGALSTTPVLSIPMPVLFGVAVKDIGYTVASSGFGSMENETIYFGPATEDSAIQFQIANKISPAVGYVGPITRARILSLSL